jgi:hypothetical protein
MDYGGEDKENKDLKKKNGGQTRLFATLWK